MCFPDSQGSVSVGSFASAGMADKSRFTLCVFMLAVFAFNPFGAILSKSGIADKPSYDSDFPGRQLHGVEEVPTGIY